MWYDKWFGEWNLGFCLILLRFWEIEDGLDFLSWCVDESAIGSAAFPVLPISFNYPRLDKTVDNRYILSILF